MMVKITVKKYLHGEKTDVLINGNKDVVDSLIESIEETIKQKDWLVD